jgi:ribosome-binding ATPase YchF (GTP1/OBG family)
MVPNGWKLAGKRKGLVAWKYKKENIWAVLSQDEILKDWSVYVTERDPIRLYDYIHTGGFREAMQTVYLARDFRERSEAKKYLERVVMPKVSKIIEEEQ